jgi:uncharacterized cupredoxin-like copper-binding protein
LVLAVLGLSACGDDGGGESLGVSGEDAAGTETSPRTVEVDMVDNAFEPAEVDVAAGETVRFVFRNTGAVVHDAVIGDEAAQEEHEDEMRAAGAEGTTTSEGDMGDMDHGPTGEGSEGGEGGDGGDEAAITVAPGEEGEIVHTFASAGELLIGCHEPGHYAAGMTVAIDVA